MKVLGIIPARGGSKGVLRKNIREVDGLPLIAYTINCAQQSTKLTEFVVNTDDEEIAQVARQFNAAVMIRPAELGTDTAPVTEVVKHIVDYYKTKLNKEFDLIVLLQVTAPLRTGEDVDNVISFFEQDSTLDGAISVVPMLDMHPARMYSISDEDRMVPFLGGNTETVNRQELKPVYYRNGCIYAVKTEALIRENKLMVQNKRPYVMNPEWLANVDDERDLLITEVLIKKWKQEHADINFGIN
jgi:CMP-N,N'-diacetyllegionaminic acid synthase